MAKKIKFNNNTEFLVTRIVDAGVDEYGREFNRAVEGIEVEEINCGSIKRPKNEDIIKVEWRIEQQKEKFKF